MLAADIELQLTSSICPEQYDALYEGQIVGYLRLRHGNFRVECPYGTEVYNANPKGDGAFLPDERDYFLRQARVAIANALAERI